MRVELSILLLSSFIFSAHAEEPNADLRKEFEAYKTLSEARISALESGSATTDTQEGGLADRTTRDFEFHGYFRAGLGINDRGDPMEAFKAPNAGAKYRLGNEAETYIEATYQQNFRTQALIDNGVDIYTKLTFAYVTPTVDNNAFDTTTSLREAYAGARGVWEGKKEAMFWAGNRFYQHLDIHMNDFFFRDMAGFGGGVEDVAIGDEMKWALAWLGGSIDELDSSGTPYQNDYNFNKNTITFSLYEIPAGIGTLDLFGDLADFGGDELDDGTNPIITIEDSFGWALGAILKSDLSDEMVNRFTIQYGTGAADNFRAVITAPLALDPNLTTIAMDDTTRLRITDDIVVDNGTPLSWQFAAVLENYDNGMGTTVDWVSTGIRPVYHFNEYFSLAFEGGLDYTNTEDDAEGVLGKFTLAPQVQPAAKHFSRPSIRAFFTYAVWSDGFEGQVATTSYADEQQGISAGVQMEAWW